MTKLPPAKPAKERFNITLSPEVKSKAAKFACEKGISFSHLIEKALTRELKKAGYITKEGK